MADVDRIPVLVFDDGSADAPIAMDRALAVASRIVLATASGSPNHARNVTAADQAGIPVVVDRLGRHTGIRHALALCAEHDIHLAVVPRPDEHPGQHLRKIVQAAAQDERRGLHVLAVAIVHPDAPMYGPVVELDPAHVDAGFAALFAAGLAGSTHRPLHILRLTGDRADADARALDALQEARRLLTERNIAVIDDTTEGDPVATALDHARGARAVVMGLGGFTVRGRKFLAPDELPDAVLETPDGHLAHRLAAEAPTDVVLVLDAIQVEHGHAAVVAAAVAALTGGTLAAGLVGLGAATAAVAAGAVGYRARRRPRD
jgi:hypothetical protein